MLFTSERRQTRVSYEQNGFPGATLTNEEMSLIIEEAVNEKREEGDKIRFGKVFLFNLNLSMKPVKKFLVYKGKLRLKPKTSKG